MPKNPASAVPGSDLQKQIEPGSPADATTLEDIAERRTEASRLRQSDSLSSPSLYAQNQKLQSSSCATNTDSTALPPTVPSQRKSLIAAEPHTQPLPPFNSAGAVRSEPDLRAAQRLEVTNGSSTEYESEYEGPVYAEELVESPEAMSDISDASSSDYPANGKIKPALPLGGLVQLSGGEGFQIRGLARRLEQETAWPSPVMDSDGVMNMEPGAHRRWWGMEHGSPADPDGKPLYRAGGRRDAVEGEGYFRLCLSGAVDVVDVTDGRGDDELRAEERAYFDGFTIDGGLLGRASNAVNSRESTDRDTEHRVQLLSRLSDDFRAKVVVIANIMALDVVRSQQRLLDARRLTSF